MKPVRTCVGCSKRDQSSELLRIKKVNGELILDSGEFLAGRGAWLHKSLACLKLAQNRNAFARALGGPSETAGLVESIEQAEKMLAKK